MPAPVPPPQTSKQAKRAYQKSSKGFKFTASQERAAARRNAKDEHARKLREKEERVKTNKRKRDDKDEKERQAKKKLVEKGKLTEDALLPKVSASQPRLNLFMRQAAPPLSEGLTRLSTRCEDDEAVKHDRNNKETLVNENQPEVPPSPDMSEDKLEGFSSTVPAEEEGMTTHDKSAVAQEVRTKFPENHKESQQQEIVPELDNSELEAQLGCALSQALVDFEICEDPLSKSEDQPGVTPLPRKRKRSSEDFATPSKSTRSVLSEMSPAKVLLRSQEKPDATSVPSIAAKMLSPEHDRPSAGQAARQILAMISSQDIADDIDFSPQKENSDPARALSFQRQCLRGSQGKSACATKAGPSKSLPDEQTKASNEDYFDDTIDAMELDELMNDIDEAEDFDDGLEEADWAGLSIQPAKNTVVSLFGSPKKAKDISAKTSTKTMVPPPRPSPVTNLIAKLEAATPKKPTITRTELEQEPPSASQSSDFENGISDADWATISTQMPTTLAMSTSGSPVQTQLKALAVAARLQCAAPSGSQNYSFDADLEADMLELVDEIDFAGNSSTKRAKKGRILPWQNRPEKWNTMMTDDEENEASQVTPQRNA